MTRCAFLLIGMLAVATNAAAQSTPEEAEWPKKVIRLIVSAAPGSAGDTVCRIVAQKLGERLGQQLIIDNRAADHQADHRPVWNGTAVEVNGPGDAARV